MKPISTLKYHSLVKKMTHRRPTHRALVRTLVRSHVARLNTCIYGTQTTDGDDFVLYFIHDNDCDDTIVTLHINDEFIVAPQRQFIASEDQYFGLDTSSVKVEKVPMVIAPVAEVALKRIK